MRTIKKPRFEVCVCSRCGCVFKPNKRKEIGSTVITQELFTRCPVCNKETPVKLKKSHKGEKEGRT